MLVVVTAALSEGDGTNAVLHSNAPINTSMFM